MSALPLQRPQMPTQWDEYRSKHSADRLAVLDEEHIHIAEKWMEAIIPDVVLESWGPPDLSINLMAEICLQFATPGLYGSVPSIDHADGTEAVTAELDRAAFWSLAQRLQYLALGIGEMLVRLEWLKDGGVSTRLVMPHNVWVDVHPDDPMRMVRYGELRLRTMPITGKEAYTWDVFDIKDPENPTYRVYEAKSMGGLGDDLSAAFLPPEAKPYPWRRKDGAPFIPVIAYHSQWSGKFWNHSQMRGVYHGTLNAITYATYTAHSAHSASGSTVIVSGMEPIVSGNDRTTDSGAPIRSIVLQPGTMLYHTSSGEGQPMVTEVGPGANLETLSKFVQGYAAQMLTRSGLSAPDVTRGNSSPTSGAALYISNKDKREQAARIEPSFRRSDLELIGKLAAMLNVQDGTSLPESGYSITYAHPPESPQEEADRRADIDWRVARGMMSRIEAYQALHPGSTREAALRAMRQAYEDEQLINREAPAPNGENHGVMPPL